MAVTVYDIADKLSTSHSTVSRALRDDPRVAVDTRKRVKMLAQKMGYRPNLLARGLTKGKTHTIGFLAGSSLLEVVSAEMKLLDELSSKAGYELYISHTSGSLEQTVKKINEFVARGSDGLIIRGSFRKIPVEQLRAKMNLSIPTVFVDKKTPFACRNVTKDGSVGVRHAVEHLYKLGHRGIYMLHSNWGGWETDSRFTGFNQVISDLGLDDGRQRQIGICETSRFNEDGRREFDRNEIAANMGQFLEATPDCTAIMCSSDALALVILSTLAGMGKNVPGDISLVGFDNISAAEYSNPTLSTVAQPIGKMVSAAFEMLMDGIDNGNNEPKQLVIPTKFIPRQSTGERRTTREA